MREVRILAPSAGVDVTVPMGEGVATLTGGLGGWQTVERQDDVAVTDWVGQAPLAQDVPLMLDGGRRRRSVERELAALLKLGRPPGQRVPPIFKVFGPVHFSGNEWVLPDGGIELSTDEDECCRRNDGELYRQALTLHLLEYVKPDTIRIRGKKNAHGQIADAEVVGGTHTVRSDARTLAKIAAKVYGDWRRWQDIGRVNGIHDPNKPLQVGRVLKLP
jgi:nucleoid-associated protein YgaU